ncbi:MAG: FAD-dependent oxidoreductase [Thermoproteota archaeon]
MARYNRRGYGIDVHIAGRVGGFLELTLQPGDYYEIPYGCLVPKDIENLLVAGRCISFDFEGNLGLRIQSVCRGL